MVLEACEAQAGFLPEYVAIANPRELGTMKVMRLLPKDMESPGCPGFRRGRTNGSGKGTNEWVREQNYEQGGIVEQSVQQNLFLLNKLLNKWLNKMLNIIKSVEQNQDSNKFLLNNC